MMCLMSSPMDLTVSSILHLVHPRDIKEQFILNEIESIDCKSCQICKLGESLLNNQRKHSFKTIAVHSCSSKNLKDYLRRLDEYQSLLKEYVKSEDHLVLVYGNALNLISDEVFIIDKTSVVYMNNIHKSQSIDISSPGLGLVGNTFDYNFSPSTVSPYYYKLVKQVSMNRSILLLTKDAFIKDDGKILRGNVFSLDKGELKPMKEIKYKGNLEGVINKINPITPIYKEDSAGDKK